MRASDYEVILGRNEYEYGEENAERVRVGTMYNRFTVVRMKSYLLVLQKKYEVRLFLKRTTLASTRNGLKFNKYEHSGLPKIDTPK